MILYCSVTSEPCSDRRDKGCNCDGCQRYKAGVQKVLSTLPKAESKKATEPAFWLISNGTYGHPIEAQQVYIVDRKQDIELARQRLSVLLDIPYDEIVVNPVGNPEMT